MDNSTWIATIAGIALGIGIILAIVILKNKEDNTTGVMYSYDDQNRLQSIVPANAQFVKLKPIGEG